MEWKTGGVSISTCSVCQAKIIITEATKKIEVMVLGSTIRVLSYWHVCILALKFYKHLKKIEVIVMESNFFLVLALFLFLRSIW